MMASSKPSIAVWRDSFGESKCGRSLCDRSRTSTIVWFAPSPRSIDGHKLFWFILCADLERTEDLHIDMAWKASPRRITLLVCRSPVRGTKSSRWSSLTSVVSAMSDRKDLNGSAHCVAMLFMNLAPSALAVEPCSNSLISGVGFSHFQEIQI